MHRCLSKAPMTFLMTRWPVMGRKLLLSVLTLVITLTGHQLQAYAATVNAASCSLSDVQAAVNAAASGDTVHLPTCTQTTWTGTVTINKRLILEGEGSANTVLGRSRVAAEFESNQMFRVSNVTGFEMRQMALDGTQDTDPGTWQDFGVSCINCVDFRFHHMTWTNFAVALMIRGNPTVQKGVVDHNTFTGNYFPWLGYATMVVGDGQYPATLPTLGTDLAVFVEDNVYNANRHNVVGHNGGRYVFRHNTIQSQRENADAIDAHGDDGSWPSGTRSWEIYGNTVACGGACGSGVFAGVGIRGGDGVIFNNTLNNTSRPIYLSSQKDTGTECTQPYPMSQQVREAYVWNNTPNTVVISSPCTSHIVLNRDYFTNARPGYTPYTYPHPLVSDSGASSAPTNLRVVSP